MKQSRESKVEDALARILDLAYSHAKGEKEFNRVGNDEGILRDALFGPKPLNDRSTK